MSSLALTQPDDQSGSTPQGGQGAEASSTTPMAGSPAERKAAFGLTADHEKSLVEVWKNHKDDWQVIRRQTLKQALRHISYKKGQQYISWDPFTMAYTYGNAAYQLSGQ